MKTWKRLVLVALVAGLAGPGVGPSGSIAAGPDSDVYVIIGPVAKPAWASGNVLAVEVSVGNAGNVVAVQVPVSLTVAVGQRIVCEGHTTLGSVAPGEVKRALIFAVKYPTSVPIGFASTSYSVTARVTYVNEANQANNARTEARQLFPKGTPECG